MQDAARFNYETPTPVPSIGPPPKESGFSRHPDTGLDLAVIFAFGLIAICAGLMARWRTRS